jgi:hypothetical protein
MRAEQAVAQLDAILQSGQGVQLLASLGVQYSDIDMQLLGTEAAIAFLKAIQVVLCVGVRCVCIQSRYVWNLVNTCMETRRVCVCVYKSIKKI